VESGLSKAFSRPLDWVVRAFARGLPPVPSVRGRALGTRVGAGLALTGSVLIAVTVAMPPAAGGSDLLILGYGIVLGAAGAVLLVRRRVSEAALGVVAALGTAVITLATLEAGTGTGAEDNQVLFLWVSFFSFWFFSLRHALLQLALIGVADAVLLFDQAPSLTDGVTRWVVTMATFLVTGLLGAWLRRALEREREESARLAVVAERIRIARELHDAAGHGVTAVSMQAAAGLKSLDDDPDATRLALEEIKRTSRSTMEDMRRLLGVLRPSDAPEDPLLRASLTEFDELVEECRQAGIHVEPKVLGDPIPLPAAIDQAAYRITQEALTNVLKHAGTGSAATVRLHYGPDALVLEITDDGRGQPTPDVPSAGGSNRGLSGMRERAEMFGGVFDAGRIAGGGFRVFARLPLGRSPRPTSGPAETEAEAARGD
jgi:signal transduction histidine kinase